MLRITQQNSADGAKSYFATADYYVGDPARAGERTGELPGVWCGKAAQRLGLHGEIKRHDWVAMCDNIHPQTSAMLTQRTRQQRRVGYDFTFGAPKSLSLLYTMTRDERLLQAFQTSVDETMQEVERDMRTRVRTGGADSDRTTGNMVWGSFTHLTSRPIDSVPDPHLHCHCFAFNTTWDHEEGRFKAGQFAGVKRDGAYFEAVFHTMLAERVARLGLDVERTKTGWEISGFTRSTIDKFSRRTALVEQLAKEQGITDPRVKDGLGARSREKKAQGQSFDDLVAAWTSRLTPDEVVPIVTGQRHLQAAKDAFDDDHVLAGEACARAIGHAFERASVVPERTVLAFALRQSVGHASLETTRHAFATKGLLTATRDGRTVVTTREVLAEEQALLTFARTGRGTCAPLGSKDHTFADPRLNADQRRAVLHVLTSKDRVIVVRGAAGVGKTTMMKEAVNVIEAGRGSEHGRSPGRRVFTVAPSADASRGVLRNEGFTHADTVARLLLDEKWQAEVQGQVIWVDEAGLLGTKTMRDLFSLAERLHARVVLSGDTHQHKSVERGDALRLLEQEAGLAPAEIKEIQRQKDKYKGVVKDLSEGRVAEAFERLSDLGWIQEVDDAERTTLIAHDYVDSVTSGVETLVVSPTHAEGDQVTRAIRAQLKDLGRLTDGRATTVLVNANLTAAERADPLNYAPGDVLVFHQNAKGYRKGQRVVVAEGAAIPIDLADRYTVFHARTIDLARGDAIRVTRGGTTLDGRDRLNNGEVHTVARFTRDGDIVLGNGRTISKEYGHLTHGYVATSHASQGRSVPRVLIAQSSASFNASSREQFYVSVSRGKSQAIIYTDDKEALLDAVQESDDRPSATEVMLPHEQAPSRALHGRARVVQHLRAHGVDANHAHQPLHVPRREPERPTHER